MKKSYIFEFDKVLVKFLLILAGIFLIIGIYQSTSPKPLIEAIKPDLSNFSKYKPVSILLDQETINPNIEYKFTDPSCRRASCTDKRYQYFLIRIFNQPYILESALGSTVIPGSTIAILDTSSEGGAKNKQEIIDSVNNKIASTQYRITSVEYSKLKIIKHFTETDSTISNYWGWIGFATTTILAFIYYSSYLWGIVRYNIGWLWPSEKLILNISAQKKSQHITNKAIAPQIKSQNTKLETRNYVQISIFLGVFGVHNFLEKDYYFGFLHLIWLICMIFSIYNFELFGYMFWSSFILLVITFIFCLFEAFNRLIH